MSIAQALIDHAEKWTGREQAEDEIAAVNMAIGASYAGRPAWCPLQEVALR